MVWADHTRGYIGGMHVVREWRERRTVRSEEEEEVEQPHAGRGVGVWNMMIIGCACDAGMVMLNRWKFPYASSHLALSSMMGSGASK